MVEAAQTWRPVGAQEIPYLRLKAAGGIQAPSTLLDARDKYIPFHGRSTPCGGGRRCTCRGYSIGVMPKGLSGSGQVVIPPYCPPTPSPSADHRQLASAIGIQLARTVKHLPPISVEPTPLIHPGYRGERRSVTKSVVVFGTTAGAVAAGVALLAAAGGSVGAAALGITSLQVTGATPTALFSFTPSYGDACQTDTLTFTASAVSASTNLFFSVARAGKIVIPEFQFLTKDQVPLQFQANGGDPVTIFCRNPDASGAWVLDFDLDLWVYPAALRDDSLYNKINRSSAVWPVSGEC